MKDLVQQLNATLLDIENFEARKAYLENLAEYESLKNSPQVWIDERDYSLYTVVETDNYFWLGENMRYKTADGCTVFEQYAEDDEDEENPLPEEPYIKEYGYLYSRMGVLKACPEGWELPNNKAWHELLMSLGGYYNVFTMQTLGAAPLETTKALQKGGALGDFDLRFGGGYSDFPLEEYGVFWSASNFPGEPKETWFVYFSKDGSKPCLNLTGFSDKYSCRFVRPKSVFALVKKINSTLRQIENAAERKLYLESLGEVYERLKNSKEAFIDERDYQLYPVVKIGEQYWLAENFRYATPTGAYWQENLKTMFYTEDALPHGLCPIGTTLPSSEDWEQLFKTVKEDTSRQSTIAINLSTAGVFGFDAQFNGIMNLSSNKFENSKEASFMTATNSSNGRHYLIFMSCNDAFCVAPRDFSPERFAHGLRLLVNY